MKRLTLILTGLVLSLNNIIAGDGDRILNFIFCSDVHYGTKREFRGERNETADSVNRAMIATFRMLEGTPLPEDGGVAAGKIFGTPAFVACTGDITNRMEGGVQTAAESWRQFCRDWSTYCDIPPVSEEDDDVSVSRTQGDIPLYLVPGNHDVSNATGYPLPLDPERDASSLTGIWNHNMAVAPDDSVSVSGFDYGLHKIHYSFVRDSIRFVFMGMWPDSVMRTWFDRETASDEDIPVFIFTHDPPQANAKHFTNPNGSHDINAVDKFQNLLSDTCSVNAVGMKAVGNWRVLERFLHERPSVKAWFHGDENYNEFYTWNGPDGSIALPVFRVDSPMRSFYSSSDETILSFIAVSIDPVRHLLTARECLWNTWKCPGIVWGDMRTIEY